MSAVSATSSTCRDPVGCRARRTRATCSPAWTPRWTGFDSLNGDPLGEFTLEPDDITDWTHALRERMGTRPVVGVLEGGYRLDLLAAGVVAHVGALS
jgi:hypothetical protein